VQRAWEGETTAVYPIVMMCECEVLGWELRRCYAVMFELPRSGDDPAASLGHDARLHVANHGNGLGIPALRSSACAASIQHLTTSDGIARIASIYYCNTYTVL
jgi:hypothetical protein